MSRDLPVQVLLDLLDLGVGRQLCPSLGALLLVAVEGVAAEHLLGLLRHPALCRAQRQDTAVSPPLPSLAVTPSWLFVLTPALTELIWNPVRLGTPGIPGADGECALL